ncbi:LCP family protein [Catenuloplanes japonicus]|uniref:LCP family protein n=1 Tax=Catenuloplanes japonicus TaxID=33876 RepID=UPI000526B588|nr:LCP family protein [Catenuloplanes japonicus]
MIENELRETFARHEHLVPDQGPLRQAIEVTTVRRRRRRLVVRSAGAALAVTAVLAVPALFNYTGGSAAPAVEVASSASPPETPVTPVAAARPLNVLVIGVDQGRADTVVIAHVPAARDAVYLVSLPRDGHVVVPQYSAGEKLSVAYDAGGADLMRRTVRELTGLTFDGTVTVSYPAVKALTDEVGGVQLCLDAGCENLDGADATALLRARHQVRDGDASPDRPAQRCLGALAAKAADAGLLALIQIGGDGVTLDDAGLKLLGEVGDIDLAGEPVVGIGAPRYSAIPLDDGEIREQVYPGTADALFTAIADDSLAAFVAAHPDHVTGQQPQR